LCSVGGARFQRARPRGHAGSVPHKDLVAGSRTVI
jgi:hypothetical protein